MDYIIEGGNKLNGEIEVYGAKNCALALLGATALTDEEIVLTNCPVIVDVDNMINLLRSLGKKITRSKDVVCVSGTLTKTAAPRDYATLLRGSALILGSVLSRYGTVDLPLPGGCAIGARPMDIHLQGMESLGAETYCLDNLLHCRGKLRGNRFRLRFASVGATENMLCACSLAEGVSVIENCATEPEVVALERMLVKMGAEIDGVGNRTVCVRGVKNLCGTEFKIIPDRIVCATYVSAVAASGGDVLIKNCEPKDMTAFTNVIKRKFELKINDDSVRITAKKRPRGYGKIVTAPYPKFPTDMQSLMLSLAACSNGGTTTVTENLFENRLVHNSQELRKMGAKVEVKGNTAKIVGKDLRGAEVTASDLRGGAGLIIAALSAEGKSRIGGVEHIDRGYSQLGKELANLGANISFG